jgi:hypothetical protein
MACSPCCAPWSGFGANVLDKDDCIKLREILRGMKIPQGKARHDWVNADQATDIRAMAHQLGRPSIALAQAIQFECMLRQKDVIGEYVPLTEAGVSDIFDGNKKWLRGVRWEEIDGEPRPRSHDQQEGQAAAPFPSPRRRW